MLNHLTRRENCWAISRIEKHDGHEQYISYHSSRESAEKRFDHYNHKAIVQLQLWEGDDGCFYRFHYPWSMEKVHLDVPTRDEVLAILTPEQKIALGVS